MKKIVLLAFSIILFATTYAQTVRKVVPTTVYSTPDSTKIFNQPFDAGTLILNRQNGSLYMLGKSYANMSLATAPKTLASPLNFPDTLRQSIFTVNSTTIDLMSPIGTATKYSSYYQTKDTFEIKTVGTYSMGVQRTAGVKSEAGSVSLYFERNGLNGDITIYDGDIFATGSHGIQYTPILYENLNTNSLVPRMYVDSLLTVLWDSIAFDTTNLRVGYGLQVIGDSLNLSQAVFDSIAAVPVYTGSNTISIVGDSINISQGVYDTINTKIPFTGYLNSNIHLVGRDTLSSVTLDTLGMFFTRAVDTANNNYTELLVMGSSFDVNVNTQDNTITSYLAIDVDTIDIASLGTISYTAIGLDTSDIVVTGVDSVFKGVLYAADYSANYINRSLVDRDNAMKYTVIETVEPASATATGVKGTVIVTAGYIYICTETDTWVRVAITTWE